MTWKNIAKSDRPQIKIWRACIASWVLYPFQLNESTTLDYRESKCFLRGPEILMRINNYKQSQ